MVDFNKIEKKWQKKWEEKNIFVVKEGKKKKYFCLEMYPYPSASFLHMGHVRNYTIGDVYARFKRMNGYNVLYPMGYDSFGLPAETAAKKEGIHPKKYAESSIKRIMEYQKELGNSYDWNRVIASHDSEYYKWNQFFFLKLFEKGLAYRKKAPVNWCENCESVLADEEAEGGKCWRCGEDVIKKDLEQWFFKITDYADRLLKDLDKIDWPEKIKVMQENWIGKSYGTEINFEVLDDNFKQLEFIFFHAYKDNSQSVFWNELKREIEKRGGKVVFAPDLPGGETPKIEEQLNFVLKKHNFSRNTVIVAHSMGNLLSMKLIPMLKTKIKRLIMVAPPIRAEFKDNRKRPQLENYCDFKFDFEKIKSAVDKIDIIEDLADHIIPEGHAKELTEKLSANLYQTKGNETHFNGKKEPEIEKVLFRKWSIFTTRPDTLWGVTFMVFAPEHPKVLELVKGTEYEKKVREFIKKVAKEDRFSRDAIDNEKEGLFIGKYAVNPLTNKEIPIYIANFVLLEYGTGLIMAVPTHDQRDFEFARRYNIPMKVVINPPDYELNVDKMNRAYEGDGVLVNSGPFDGTNNKEAIKEINDYLEKKKLGKKVVHYKLRDWLISRQRYWGTPIPIIYCDKCGVVAVPEKDLPVLLPEKVDFNSKINPLLSNESFINVKCPKCKSAARRETDTMGGFVDSSWYFLRYCDNKNTKKPFDKKKVDYWMPVDQYIGGAEHAVMHLIYARFFTKALKDLGFVGFDEPFKKLFNQGIVYKNGAKMSKSKGNVVFQTDISNKYGIDTARLFLMFVSSPDKQMEWSDEGIEGAFRFLKRVYGLLDKHKSISNKKDKNLVSKTNKLIAEVTDEIEDFRFNTAIVGLMEYVNYLYEVKENISKKVFEDSVKKLCLLMSPFTPHLCEEIWSKLSGKGFVSLAKWPQYDKSKIDIKLEASEELVKKTIDDINAILKLVKSKPDEIQIFVSVKWKYDLFKKLKKELEKTREFKEIINKVMVKEYGNEISKIVQSVIKDPSKVPDLVLEQSVEFKALSENKDVFEKAFGCKCKVIKAEDSTDNKAKNAMPNKPGVLVG